MPNRQPALGPIWRLTFAWNMGLAVLTTFAVLILGALTMPAASAPLRLHRALEFLELTVPLGCAIGCAHLSTIDHEERTLELRFSYAAGRWTLMAERLLPALGLLTLYAISGWAILYRAAPSLTMATVLAAVVPPTLALLAATWVSGLATGNAWVAAGAPLLWWGAALAVPRRAAEAWLRRVPLSFHLFQTTRPISGIGYSLNRWLLVALAAALIIGAGWLLRRQQPTSR